MHRHDRAKAEDKAEQRRQRSEARTEAEQSEAG
jgi:hypothetical protein